MNPLWILCLTFLASGYAQENEEAILQRDLQDFVRRFTQQQMQRTTQQMRSSFLPQLSLGAASGEEQAPPLASLLPPFRQSDARAYASVKRPYGSNAEASASAYASVRDVDGEERLTDHHLEAAVHSTILDDDLKSTSPDGETTFGSSSGSTGPQASKHLQIENVIRKEEDSFSDVYFVAIVAGCCAVGIFGVISAGFCFYKLQKSRKAAADVDYPAYGVTGPCKDVVSPNGDRKLAQSAQMYHYQHQKQQMIAVEKAGSTKNTSASDVDSEEEIGEEGDYTVYECPGLAPTGEMEVKNPLFHDDSTPVSPPVLPGKTSNLQSN